MGKKDLQCLFIGKKPRLYTSLLEIINEFNFNFRVKRVDERKVEITTALKDIRGVSFVFISDQTSLPIYTISDLVWQYSPEAIVIILTEKMPSVFFKHPLNNLVLARLNIREITNESQLFLGCLVHITQLKQEFRHCKRLLGFSERRCQRLMDSSKEAIAFISRDLHLYANQVYLDLFEIETLQLLRTISLQDVFLDSEYALFCDFLKAKKYNRTLLIDMRKRNGAIFRVRLLVIPSVLNGKQCLQISVHPIADYLSNEEQVEDKNTTEMERLMDQQRRSRRKALLRSKDANNTVKDRDVVSSPIKVLKSVISRKEVTLSVEPFKYLMHDETIADHYFVTLKTPASLKAGIDKLLFSSASKLTEAKQVIFWDKVKFVKLLQLIKRRKKISQSLLIRFNSATVSDESFVKWFISNLEKINCDTSCCTYMFPVSSDKVQIKQSLIFIKKLRQYNSKIALDNFSASKESMLMLKKAIPDYVRLSSSWVMPIDGNEVREIALASFIRQVESKKIKIIAPCGLGKNIRRLFILAGVSFCQEKVINNG